MAESVEALLNHLFGTHAESAVQAYALGTGTPIVDIHGHEATNLEQIVRRGLVAAGKSAQLRESLLATVKAGGALGESVEQTLIHTGLTGWT